VHCHRFVSEKEGIITVTHLNLPETISLMLKLPPHLPSSSHTKDVVNPLGNDLIIETKRPGRKPFITNTFS